MSAYFPVILLPFIVLVTVTFILFRLRLFSGDYISGRSFLLSGGTLLFLVSVWQGVKSSSGYGEWFVTSAYPLLDLAQFSLLLIGLVLAVVGFSQYGDFWQTRKEEIESREQKLSVLDDLQREARQPYQLLELLDISIKEIIAHLPECAGAVFLLNRSRRQFVLASSVGLTKEETAALEYYPLERNIVSQAVDLGDPLIAGSFDFVDRTGVAAKSRFRSCLVLPLVSEMEKIGGIILFAEQAKFFGRAQICYLSPVAEWLAEKIKSARLSRELSLAKSDSEKNISSYADFTERLLTVVGSFSSPDKVTSFCERLVGLASCQSVHLFGLQNGALLFHGGSEPLEQLSENYQTALVDALERAKPLIVNQEAVTDEGRSYIAFSSLVFPLKGNRSRDALLLRMESGPFKVDQMDLKNIEIFAGLAALVLEQIDSRRLDISRRKGFEKILQLLRFDATETDVEDWNLLVRHLADILPTNSAAVVFAREPNGSFKARQGFPTTKDNLASFNILPGEGNIRDVADTLEPNFTFGTNKVTRLFESYTAPNREAFRKLFGEKQLPIFLATCPITDFKEVVAVAVIFIFDIAESERTEWERLITLVTGLYSTRLTMHALQHKELETITPGEPSPDALDEIINRLNNHLSAVIGNAELASTRIELPEQIRSHIQSIINEAEQAASYLRGSLSQMKPGVQRSSFQSVDLVNINDVLNSILKTALVSGNVYMLGGKPREISTRFNSSEKIGLSDEAIRNLAEEAFNRFASLAQDEDVISISTYEQDDHVYLDVSRHRKNFPSVERVAGFGEYYTPAEVLRYRPTDTFLQHVVDKNCFCAFDRFGRVPSYLSFKFPVKANTPSIIPESSPKARVLAVDDQQVILDLISAMCRSLGYDVQTALSGEEGLKLASQTAFDIVLTDLAMPGISGLDVARSIRRLHPHTPIVLVTGWEVNIAPSELEAAGITEVLYKPFRIEQLTDIIQSAVLSNPLL